MKYGDQGYLRLLSLFSQKVLEEEDPLEGFLFYPRNIVLLNLPAIVFIFNGVSSIFKLKELPTVLFTNSVFINKIKSEFCLIIYDLFVRLFLNLMKISYFCIR